MGQPVPSPARIPRSEKAVYAGLRLTTANMEGGHGQGEIMALRLLTWHSLPDSRLGAMRWRCPLVYIAFLAFRIRRCPRVRHDSASNQ